MQSAELVLALKPVADQLERLNVRYYIGGSVASSAYGRARSTADIDLVADLQESQIDAFVAPLTQHYCLSVPAIRQAVRSRSCFNLIFLPNSSKVDIFLPRSRPYDIEALNRAKQESLGENDQETVWLASPEDVILSKLEWFRLSNESLGRQIDDIVGILKVQGELIDENYLRRWAGELGLTELLERVLRQSGG